MGSPIAQNARGAESNALRPQLRRNIDALSDFLGGLGLMLRVRSGEGNLLKELSY